MNSFRTFDAELYAMADTATVVLDGFAFRTNHDACIVEHDGVLKATKFGLYRIGPSAVQNVREEYQETDGELYDRVERDSTVKLYFGDEYYIGTTIERIYENDEFAVFDTEKSLMYDIQYDTASQGEYNLIGESTKTITKIDSDELENSIGEKFRPVVKIEPSRL